MKKISKGKLRIGACDNAIRSEKTIVGKKQKRERVGKVAWALWTRSDSVDRFHLRAITDVLDTRPWPNTDLTIFCIGQLPLRQSFALVNHGSYNPVHWSLTFATT